MLRLMAIQGDVGEGDTKEERGLKKRKKVSVVLPRMFAVYYRSPPRRLYDDDSIRCSGLLVIVKKKCFMWCGGRNECQYGKFNMIRFLHLIFLRSSLRSR